MAQIVILPGWMQTSLDWKQTIESLPQHKCTVIDLPGFGITPLTSSDWGVPEYAEYVLSIILSKKYTDVILIGHSFGGRIAAHLASQKPAWLKALVLYGAPCLYRPLAKTKFLIKLAKLAKKIGLKGKGFIKNPELADADNKGMGTVFRKIVGFDQTSSLTSISIPTLLLWGKYDPEAPLRIGEEIHTLIPQNTLEVIDDAGHHLHLTHPYLFYAKITHFIENL